MAAAAAEAWAGKGDVIASFFDVESLFAAPAIGWQTYVDDEAQLLAIDGILWKGYFVILGKPLPVDARCSCQCQWG